MEGTVDVGATYGGFGENGEILRGAFLEVGPGAEEILVVDSFGAIPSDVIATHVRVPADVCERMAIAFEEAEGDTLDAIPAIFGVVRFVRGPLGGYDALRTEVGEGVDSGVLAATAALLSTRPPVDDRPKAGVALPVGSSEAAPLRGIDDVDGQE